MPRLVRPGPHGDQTIDYEIHGERGPVVLLCHNLLTDRTVFAAQAKRLAGRYRLVLPDLRGHGESRGVPAPFTIADLAEDLAAVLDHAGLGPGPVAVVGQSLGAAAAMALARARPERVSALVLLSATAWTEPLGGRLKTAALSALVQAIGLRQVLVRHALGILFGRSFAAESPEVVAAWGARIGRMRPRDVVCAAQAWAGRPLLLPELPALRVPTLVLSGDEDVACPPPHGAAICAAIPGAEMAVVPKAGHSMSVERPQETSERIEAFLDRR